MFLKRKLFWTSFALLILIAYGVWDIENYLIHLRRKNAEMDRDIQQSIKANRQLSQFLESETALVKRDLMRQKVEEAMVQIRGLPVLSKVKYESMSKQKLKEYLISKIAIQYSKQELAYYEQALWQLHLLPRNAKLLDSMLDLLAEQVAAFYDPDTHTLYTFDPIDWGDHMQRMILAHEFVHALQDQHFNLNALPLRKKDNDDRALAAQSLVEGDASYQTGVYLRENFNPQEMMDDSQRLWSQNTQKLSQAPRFLRDALLFPYREGRLFVAELHERGGNLMLDLAFKNLPRSSEQILHPEKFWGVKPDLPVEVKFSFKPKSSWKKRCDNVVGELGVQSMLDGIPTEKKALEAAAGWGGDRYLLYESEMNQWILIWKSVWDSEKDAREFFNALEKFFAHRYSIDNQIKQRKEEKVESVFYTIATQKQNITIYGKTVWFLDVPDLASMNVLLKDVEVLSEKSNRN